MTTNDKKDVPQISASTSKIIGIVIVVAIIAGVFYAIPSKKDVRRAIDHCGMDNNFGKAPENEIDCTLFSNYSKYLK